MPSSEGKIAVFVGGKVRYVARPGYVAPPPPPPPKRKRREAEEAEPIDPAFLQTARELRDRWLERVNAGEGFMAIGKHDVSRAVPALSAETASAVKMLPAAA